MTRFLVVLTDVRPAEGAGRDERNCPERRRQVVGASSREAADRIAGAFMALGAQEPAIGSRSAWMAHCAA